MTLSRPAATLSLQANAQAAAGLPTSEKRRRVLRAVQERDHQAVWDLVLAYVLLNGRRGAKISPGTLKQYHYAFLKFWTWLDEAGVELLRPHADAGRVYVRHLESRGLVRSNVGVHLASVRALYETLRWCGATDAEPFRDVRPAADPRPRHQKGKLYSPEHVDALLSVADQETRIIVLLGADLGMRAGEIGSLRRDDVHLHEDPPSVLVRGKGAKTRVVPLSRRAEDALRHWLTLTPSWGPYVLTATSVGRIEYVMKKLCREAGVPYDRRVVHGLRRTAGTRLYAQTKDLLEVRDFLGHSSVTATEVYVQYERERRKPSNRDWD